ncbi:MAG: Na+/H+ antiporter subunit E [Pseudomonadota bacterium]|nr:MAG: Na+/H+ antiporter subunit E [Pseudomonadota bacterium]
MLLANILLAVAWAALQGEFSLSNLVIGYLLGYVILAGLARGGVLPGTYRKKVGAAIKLAGFLFRAFIIANIKMAVDVLRAQRHLAPGIVRVPLDVQDDYEILLLSTIINLTPGTVVIDVANDKKALFLHVMHVTNPEAVRAEIKDEFERRVLELTR